MALARDPDSVRLLWEVCQVPDFQSVLTEAHTRLLSRVFRFLRAPAEAHPRGLPRRRTSSRSTAPRATSTRCSRASRRSGPGPTSRTARRGSPDARFWQERTRAVEDRLSDALHERLTQEFVDRAGTVIARHDPAELVTSVTGDGEVLVQGLRAGVLTGFRFRPERDTSDGSRALRAGREPRPARARPRARAGARARRRGGLRPRTRSRAAVARRRGGDARRRRERARPTGRRAGLGPPRRGAQGEGSPAPRRVARGAPARGAWAARRTPRVRCGGRRSRARLRARGGPGRGHAPRGRRGK